LNASIAPIVPTAPGLFSTITFQPSLSESAFATMMRARMSGAVLAEYGTMRMTLDG